MHTYGGDARRAKRDHIMAIVEELRFTIYELLHDIPFVWCILYIHFGDIGVRTTYLLAMCNHTTGRARLLEQNTTRIILSTVRHCTVITMNKTDIRTYAAANSNEDC
jgi:hypothetical protein